jgi:hypothetical protein
MQKFFSAPSARRSSSMAIKFELSGASRKRSKYPTEVYTANYTGTYRSYPKAQLKFGKW